MGHLAAAPCAPARGARAFCSRSCAAAAAGVNTALAAPMLCAAMASKSVRQNMTLVHRTAALADTPSVASGPRLNVCISFSIKPVVLVRHSRPNSRLCRHPCGARLSQLGGGGGARPPGAEARGGSPIKTPVMYGSSGIRRISSSTTGQRSCTHGGCAVRRATQPQGQGAEQGTPPSRHESTPGGSAGSSRTRPPREVGRGRMRLAAPPLLVPPCQAIGTHGEAGSCTCSQSRLSPAACTIPGGRLEAAQMGASILTGQPPPPPRAARPPSPAPR